MKVVFQDEIDYRNGLITGVSFWVGVGFQNGVVFPEFVSVFAGGFLQNGMIAGGLAAIVMTAFVELMKPRPSRIEVKFDTSSFGEIRDFISTFATGSGWDEVMADPPECRR